MPREFHSAIVAYVLPPPPATLLLIVDAFGVQDAASVGKARRRLRELGYETAIIVATTDGFALVEGTKLPALLPAPVPCPAPAPHDGCGLCHWTGLVEALDTLPGPL